MAPVDTGHRLPFDASTPAVGWVAYLAEALWDPAQTSTWILGREAYTLVESKAMGCTSPVVYGRRRLTSALFGGLCIETFQPRAWLAVW